MAIEYELTVQIDQSWVAKWQSKKQLCFASGISNGSDPTFDVVGASEGTLAANVSFKWTEEYKIAGSVQKLQNGVDVSAQTTAEDIKVHESYKLQHDWTDSKPSYDEHAPSNGFRFLIPRGIMASAVIYKKVQNAFHPIYISPDGPLPEGVEELIPVLTVRVWFQSGTNAGNMIEEYTTSTLDIDFTDKTSHVVRFDDKGSWSLES